MLSVRNAVIAAASLLILSIMASLLTMVQEPDSGGTGNDSFGTRGYGYRALYETLNELQIPVTRLFSPPISDHLQADTLVFLKPAQMIVATEPSYLNRLQSWVEKGGRIVVAPDPSTDQFSRLALAQFKTPPPDFLQAIGLPEVRLVENGTRAFTSSGSHTGSRPRNAEEVVDDIFNVINSAAPLLQETEVQIEGSFPELVDAVSRLSIPAAGIAFLESAQPPDGSVVYRSKDNSARTLVARFRRGSGEIIVISDPVLLTNRLLANSDNSVLAARLLAPDQQAVVFDEFYHGLGVRGQPLYLLTRLSFASTTLAILLTLALFTWRKAIIPGPPLADDQVRRRDIREYIHAMAHFFSEGGRGRRRLVQELKDGVIRQLSIETGLPPDAADVEKIAAVIARRDGQRARSFLDATHSVDQALQSRQRWSHSETLDAMQRMSACL